MREQFSGFMSPTVLASGRLQMAHGGAPAFVGARPGFTAVIVDNAAGDETVNLAVDPTAGTPNLGTCTCVILATSETAQLFVSTSRPTAGTIRIQAMTNAGVLTDALVSIVVLIV
jgi:hypothetical protein